MDLGADTQRGLRVLADKRTFSTESVTALCALVFDIVLGVASEDSLQRSPLLSHVDAALLKQAYSSLVTVTVEGAKSHAEAAVVGRALEEAGLPLREVQHFSSLYTTHREALRAALRSVGFPFPEVVGVDWRLDYSIKSKEIEKVDLPTYILTLQTRHPDGRMEDVAFTCTLEQLQELTSKIRDATKQVDRMLAKP